MMEHCGFRCMRGPYKQELNDVVFTNLDDYNILFNPWGQSGLYYDDVYSENFYTKNYFKRCPYKYADDDFEQFENQYRNKNAAFEEYRGSQYHHEAETKPLGKRNRYLPNHFQDYLIEMPGQKRHYSGKTCYDNFPKQWNKNGDLEQFENKKRCFSKRSTAFVGELGSQYHHKTDAWSLTEETSCFPMHSSFIEIPREKQRYFSKTPSHDCEGIEMQKAKSDDIEQFKNEYDYSCNKFKKSGDYRDFKYLPETRTDQLRQRNSSLPNDYVIEMSGEKIIYSKKKSSRRCKNKQISEKHSSNGTTGNDFTRCSFFQNSDNLIKLMFYQEENFDDVFLKHTSKDVMLCGDVVPNIGSVVTKNQETNDDITRICDCPSIVTT